MNGYFIVDNVCNWLVYVETCNSNKRGKKMLI